MGGVLMRLHKESNTGSAPIDLSSTNLSGLTESPLSLRSQGSFAEPGASIDIFGQAPASFLAIRSQPSRDGSLIDVQSNTQSILKKGNEKESKDQADARSGFSCGSTQQERRS